MAIYRLTGIIEKDEDGYFAYCPEIQGCHTQGDTLEEAIDNLRDAIRLNLEDQIAQGEEPTKIEWVTVTTVEVTV